MQMMKAGFLCLGFSAAAASTAQAQMVWTDKGFVNVNVGVQSGSRDLKTESSFPLYREEAQLRTSQTVDADAFFDVSAGYKVWRNLTAGIGISRATSEADVEFAASIPDPLLFDSPRSVTATVSGADHTETAVHLNGTWMVPVTDKVDVGLSFGPTIFSVKQDVPTELGISEPGPNVTSTAFAKESKTTVGVTFGIDVTYLITKRYGVGGFARYTRGSVDLPGATDSLTLGGFFIGVGGRYRF